MLKIYVSGPIGGYVDLNLPAFEAAADLLKRRGYDPIVPHDIPASHEGFCAKGKPSSHPEEKLHLYGCYLLQDIAVLAQCDGIYLLKGWQDSPGAKAEMAFAEALALEMFYEEQ